MEIRSKAQEKVTESSSSSLLRRTWAGFRLEDLIIGSSDYQIQLEISEF